MHPYGNYGVPAVPTFPPPMSNTGAGLQLPTAVIRVGENSLWSTFQYADAAPLTGVSRVCYTTPLGQTGQGYGAPLSLEATNMREAGRLPSGQAYDVFAIACQIYNADNTAVTGAMLRNMINNMVVAWDFIQTVIEIAPSILIGAGGGLFGATADTGDAQTGQLALNNGNGQVWVYQQFPVQLSANSTFSIRQIWGTPATAVDGGLDNSAVNIRICMLGRYKTALASG